MKEKPSHLSFVVVGKLHSNPLTNRSLVRVDIETAIRWRNDVKDPSREDEGDTNTDPAGDYSIQTIEPNLPQSGLWSNRSVSNEFLLAAWDRNYNDGTIAAVVVSNEEGEDEASYWLRYGIGVAKEKRVRLPEMASSLYVIGNAVFLGFRNSLGWIDCSVENPFYREIYHRKDHRQQERENDAPTKLSPSLLNAFPSKEKAYEMFARKGSMLVAVDDTTYPYYAEQFSLEAAAPLDNGNDLNNNTNGNDNKVVVGGISHNQTWALPALINDGFIYGSYRLVDILPDDNQLLLVSGGSYRTANYQNLERIPLSNLQQPSRADFETYCVDTLKGSSLKEYQRRNFGSGGNGVETHTLTKNNNNKMTRWRDMAVGDKSVWLAAGERGLLCVPGNLPGSAGNGSSVPSVPKLEDGEEVTTVQILGDGEAWVTLEKKKEKGGACTELVQIQYRLGSSNDDRSTMAAVVLKRIALPGSGFRFLKEGGTCNNSGHTDPVSPPPKPRPQKDLDDEADGGWCCCLG